MSKNIAFSAYGLNDIVKGSRFISSYRSLLDNMRMSADEMVHYSNLKLQGIIKYAYENTPYYRRILDERNLKPGDIRCAEDLQLLPILTKRIIRRHFDELQPSRLPPDSYFRITSGTTGEPMKFLITLEACNWRDAAKLRGRNWTGFTLGTSTILLVGSTFDYDKFYTLGGRLRRWINREKVLNTHMLNDEICRDYIDIIRRTAPKTLNGYVNSLYCIAKYCLEHGVEDLRFDFVFPEAETLMDFQRKTIEKAFNCRVIDHYATRETSLVSHECPHNGGYHVSIDNGVIEIVRDGRWVQPGELGNVLVTDFHNRAMPFIRYQIEDVAVRGEGPCSCSRPLPTIKSIEGRMINLITLENGRIVHPFYAIYLFYPDPEGNVVKEDIDLQGILKYQVIQESYTEFRIKLVLKQGDQLGKYKYIVENYKRYFGPRTHVELESVPEIPAGPSGKQQLIISKVSPDI